MKRYYLINGRTFYGVITIFGKREILSTTKLGDANIVSEEDSREIIDYLNDRGIQVKKVEIDGDHGRLTEKTLNDSVTHNNIF